MANPRIEDAIGVIDGVNKDFTTSLDYTAGTLNVWVNGVLVRQQDDDGWNETGANSFSMKEAPRLGDTLRVFYLDTLAVLDNIEDIVATIEPIQDLNGYLTETEYILASIAVEETVEGILIEPDSILGTLSSVEDIFGVLEETGADVVQTVTADCPDTVSLGTWVCIVAPKIGSQYQVDTADASDPTRVPAFGIVTAKPSTTTAVIQWFGPLSGILTGLSTGPGSNIIWLGSNGATLQSPPAGAYQQPLGTVIDEDEVLIEPDWSELPTIAYLSHFNTTDGTNDATVDDVATSSRNVSSPDGHFDIGSWSGGTPHPTTRTSPITYATTGAFSIADDTSTILTATIYGADEVSIIAQHAVTLDGNKSSASSGVSITISNWGEDLNKYEAEASIEIDLNTILPTGGRFSVELVHDNGVEGTFSKTQAAIFYDNETNTASLSGVSIAETAGSVATRFLSGVEYYDLGSQFTAGISDIDNLNDESYPDVQADVDGSEYGLPSLALQGSDLTDWDSLWNNVDAFYEKTNWAITQVDLTLRTSLANLRARTKDWSNGAWVNSPNQAILIETHDDTDTRLVKRFYEESWRCAQTANFDAPGAKGWTSSDNKGATDALLFDGGCEHNSDDWTSYSPNAASQPDYSAHTARQYVILEVMHDGSASSGFTLPISGSYATFEYKLAAPWDGTSTGGTEWIDGTSSYNASQWNNGNPTGGSGGSLGSDRYTFGTNNRVNTGDTLYLRFGFDSGDRIEGPLSVVFD
jgi:hypothetical protein